jgi:hypothetical protein
MPIMSYRVLLPILALLAGCAGAPPQAPAGKQNFRQAFEGGLVLDYEVDTRYSSLDKNTCYAFLSGTLTNHGPYTLSRRSKVEFKVYHGDALLFRDFTYLLGDLAPGGRAQLDMTQSPLHRNGCPTYDRIDTALQKIVLQ